MDQFLKLANPSSSKPAPTSSGGTDKPQSRSKRLDQTPWVEKYRPWGVADIVSQEEVVAVMKKCLMGEDIPNLLFYGGPGTGKTSTILAMAREMFGPNDMRERVLELNSSDERGIDVIREKVKGFSTRAVPPKRSDGQPCPAIKLVVLDEADSMTQPAQEALRRIMEKESRSTRFCLICNYISRIIDPITSRCAKFRFIPLPRTQIEAKLRSISQVEHVRISEDALGALYDVSEGDLRKAITYLQSIARLQDSDSDNLTEAAQVYEISGFIPSQVMDKLLTACQSDSYQQLDTAIRQVIAEGFSANQLLSQLHDMVLTVDILSDKQKSAVALKLANVDKRIADGGDEYINLLDMCSLLMQQVCHAQL
ncbi:Replication factor C subunit 4-like [Oopsacas minuta]|uniref:Replication factor C subunit 4-like n=1 Tax=Oopsacas minuta TaxID=111878 RepID=A0AAV7JIH8_9METZ|nr:Replication factor C subunit 4-like [Oopsacas minuta]